MLGAENEDENTFAMFLRCSSVIERPLLMLVATLNKRFFGGQCLNCIRVECHDKIPKKKPETNAFQGNICLRKAVYNTQANAWLLYFKIKKTLLNKN